MLWIKAFHIIFMVTWFSGLFYLPRLYVYHALSSDETSNERFKVMERKLFWGIMTPGAILTILFGLGLLYNGFGIYLHLMWFDIKASLVGLLVIYHIYLGKLYYNFKQNRNTHGHVFYRWLNEVPVFFLIAIILLVIIKPWGTV